MMDKPKSCFPKPVYLSRFKRTPIGKFGGALRSISAGELAARALKGAVVENRLEKIDQVILGHARQAGARPNPARQAVFGAGLPETITALTVNQACASGLQAVVMAAERIALGRAQTIFAGGVESMSNTPYYLMNARWGQKLGHMEVTDGMTQDGFLCPMAGQVMGATVAEHLALKRGISRADQDAYALRSQSLADLAWNQGCFQHEVIPMSELDHDEHRRGATTLESLAKLTPVFEPKSAGITAGNASGMTDGAAFMQISSIKPDAQDFALEFLDAEVVGVDPRVMGIGPVPAIQTLFARHGLTWDAIDAVEINEAFAAQVLACQRELEIPIDKLNAWGGAIALGHPIGASGARILVTLASRLRGSKGSLGIASLCVSGGMGIAVLVRSV